MVAAIDLGAVNGALDLADRGKPVFPCRPDKTPYTPRGHLDASTDAWTIKAWWARWPDALIGLPTGAASGVVVVDLDKRQNYDGAQVWADLLVTMQVSPPLTIIASTPSGGAHLYFSVPDVELRNSASKLGRGIDIRGEGGYVIAPPSPGYAWHRGGPGKPAELPAPIIRALIGEPRPAAVPDALVIDAGPRVEGARNDYLARYAGKLAYAHLTPPQIWTAVLAENAERCDPPLGEEEIRRTVMKSALGWAGRAQDEAAADEELGTSDLGGALVFEPASELVTALKKPDFIIPDLLERGVLSVLFGMWGSGKTLLALDWAIRIAGGYPVKGREVKAQNVVYVAAEGQSGIPRRLAAWAKINGREIPSNLFFLRRSVQVGDRDSILELRAALLELQERHGPIALVILDTLARNFGPGDESSNADMSRHIEHLQAGIIGRFNCTVMELHHPGHGNKQRGRGASALPGATDEEYRVEKFGENWLRLDCTKAKDHEELRGLGYRIEVVGLEVEGEVVPSVAVVEADNLPDEDSTDRPLSGANATAFAALCELYAAARDNLVAAGRDPGKASIDVRAWREKSGLNATTFRSCKRRLVESGKVGETLAGAFPAQWHEEVF